MSRPKKVEKKLIKSFTIERDFFKDVMEAAKEDKRNLSNYIEVALTEKIERDKRRKKQEL